MEGLIEEMDKKEVIRKKRNVIKHLVTKRNQFRLAVKGFGGTMWYKEK